MLYRVISRLGGKSREFVVREASPIRAIANAQTLRDNFYVTKSGHTGRIWREGATQVIGENGTVTDLPPFYG